MIKRIAHYDEPRKILNGLSADAISLTEMTEWQHGFLCGLIKEYRPKKIVEIGVSAGGTTAVLLNTISLLGLNTEIYSIDCSKEYYRGKGKETGFLAKKAIAKLYEETENATGLKLLTGAAIVDFIGSIGNGIDFLVMDTMHICPGEILDFLVSFPYMRQGSIVVMHDIAMQFGNNNQAYATQLLLDVVTADKIVGMDMDTGFSGYPNIGAFIINEDTGKYIGDVFSALNIPWLYMPEDIRLYRDCYLRNYDKELIDLFDMALSNNELILKNKAERKFRMLHDWASIIKELSNRYVYIYGNGKVGSIIESIFEELGIKVLGHIVSVGEDRKENVVYISEIDRSLNPAIVIGTGIMLQSRIAEILEQSGITDYIRLSREVLDYILA